MEESTPHVLVDAEEAEEGEEACTPVAGDLEVAHVHMRVEVTQVGQCESGLRCTDCGVAIEVAKAGVVGVEVGPAREIVVGTPQAPTGLSDGRQEPRDGGEHVRAGVHGRDEGEVDFGERSRQVDGGLTADGEEGPLLCGVCLQSVACELVREEGVVVGRTCALLNS